MAKHCTERLVIGQQDWWEPSALGYSISAAVKEGRFEQRQISHMPDLGQGLECLVIT